MLINIEYELTFYVNSYSILYRMFNKNDSESIVIEDSDFRALSVDICKKININSYFSTI